MSDPDRRIWDGMLAHLRTQHPDVCRHWFENLQPVGIAEGSVYLRASTDIHRDYLKSRCLDAFIDAAQITTNSLLAVRFLGPGDEPAITPRAPKAPGTPAAPMAPGRDASIIEHKTNPATGSRAAESTARPAHRPHTEQPAADEFDTILLNPDYVFENFIIGPGNQWAHAAAVAVADNPGRSYNPLFIHGDVGLGKTHLLQAICLRIREQSPDRVMHYISCDGFINDFMQAVQSNEMDRFRHRFRDVDILVIDDIHFLTKRERSQEEFFHTFNSLHQLHKQIIISSDAPPEQIPHLEKRLVSRFRSGLVTEVEKPTFETRVAILFTKARLMGIELKQGVAEHVAALHDTNIRELEGAIKRLQIRAIVEGRPIDLALAREVFDDDHTQTRPQPTIDEIIKTVCRFYDVKRIDLLGKRRHKSISTPRQIGMTLTRMHTGLSLEEIGAQFGGRDHTTVMHAVKTIKAKRKQNPEFNKAFQKLESDLINGPR